MSDPENGDIETSAFVLRLRPGLEAEYRRRHDELWSEMRAALLEAGIVHYEIYLHAATGLLFGHLVRRAGSAPNAAGHEVMDRWRAYMADVLVMDGDRPVGEELVRQFRLAGEAAQPGSGWGRNESR